MQRNFTRELEFYSVNSIGNGNGVELRFHIDSSCLLSIREKSILKRKLHHQISVAGHLHVTVVKEKDTSSNRNLAVKIFNATVNNALRSDKTGNSYFLPFTAESIQRQRANG